MFTIELIWPPATDHIAGHQIGYDIGEMSVPLTALATPANNLTVHLNLESRQLYRFWVRPYDQAGNLGTTTYLKNAYQA